MLSLIREPATWAQLRARGRLGWGRGAIGAMVGIVIAGLMTRMLVQAGAPWLLAPLGASAVLVFAVPASPLAQPWSVLGGNLLSATIGLVAGYFLATPWLAAGVSVAAAIAVMTTARCLHPPGGACALLCALAAETGGSASSALLLTLGANVLVLMGMGWLYNNLTGHAWPHKPHAAAPLPQPGWLGTYHADDLHAVLEDWDEVLDVDPDDLDALFRAVERRVMDRWESAATTSRLKG